MGVVRGVAWWWGGGVVFVFPGQGSQWVGMAVELLDASPVFARDVVAVREALEEFVDWSLRVCCGVWGVRRGWIGWMWCSRCCGR